MKQGKCINLLKDLQSLKKSEMGKNYGNFYPRHPTPLYLPRLS